MVASDLPTKAKLMHTFLARLPVTSNLQIVVSGGDQEAVNGVGSRCVKAKPSASQGNWRTLSCKQAGWERRHTAFLAQAVVSQTLAMPTAHPLSFENRHVPKVQPFCMDHRCCVC